MREHYTHPPIHKAFDTLEQISADEETRQRAEARKKALKDEATLLREARIEGKEEGIRIGKEDGIRIGAERSRQQTLAEVARRLLNNGESIERVADITGLTIEQVQSLPTQQQKDSS